jgi:hypothetical protein
VTYAPRTLRELEASFIKLITPEGWQLVDTIGEADGVIFLCPKCFEDSPVGAEGTHSVICWSPKIGQEHAPRPGRWNLVGTSLDDLELVAGSSSIQIQGGCNGIVPA